MWQRFSDGFTHTASPTSYGLAIAPGSLCSRPTRSIPSSRSYLVIVQFVCRGSCRVDIVFRCHIVPIYSLRDSTMLPRRNAFHRSVTYLGNAISGSNVGASKANTQCPSLRKLRKRATAESRVLVRKQLHGRPSSEEHQLQLLCHTVSVLSLQASPNGKPCRPAIN